MIFAYGLCDVRIAARQYLRRFPNRRQAGREIFSRPFQRPRETTQPVSPAL